MNDIYEKVESEVEVHKSKKGGQYMMHDGLYAGFGGFAGALLGDWFRDGRGLDGRGRRDGGCGCDDGCGCGNRVEGRVLNRLDFDHVDGKLDGIAGEICCGFGGLKDNELATLRQRLNAVETKDIIQAAFEKQEAEARQQKILGCVEAINERQIISEANGRDAALNNKLNIIADELACVRGKVAADERVTKAVADAKRFDVIEDAVSKLVGLAKYDTRKINAIIEFLNGSDLVGSVPGASPDEPIGEGLV